MPKEMDEFLNKLEKQTGFWDATALQLICAALSFLLIMLVKNITHNFPPSMLTLFLNWNWWIFSFITFIFITFYLSRS